MRKLLLACLLVAAAAATIWLLTRRKPVEVRLLALATGSVEATVANTRAGTIQARRRAKLAPQIGGRVVALPVKRGDRVTEGQVLLELWNADVKAELLRTRSDLKRAEAVADEAAAKAEWAELEAARVARLLAQEVAAKERVDRVNADAKASRAAQRAAQADIEVQKARLEQVAAALDRTVMRAPFAGIVAEVNAELGEFATPSPTGIPMPPAIDLIDDTSLYVEAPLDEVDAAALQVGQSARVTLDAFPGRAFDGRIRQIAPYVLDREKQARTVDVEVDFVEPKEARALLPGYSADVEVVLEVREGVVRVPAEAVLAGDKVLVLDAATGTLAERAFTPGLRSWRFVEAKSGLAAGDRIVVSLDREGVAPGAKAVAANGGAQP